MTILRIAVRTDLPPGRQMSQVAHAAFAWAADHGPHTGIIHIHAARDLPDLHFALAHAQLKIGPNVALWHEPDLKLQLTAFATDGEVQLPLLGKVK